MTEQPPPDAVQVRVEWPIHGLSVPVASNVVAVQPVSDPTGQAGALVITLGFAEGPIAPDVERQRQLAATLTHVDVQVVGRFVLSPARAREFGELLIRSADAVTGKSAESEGEGS